MNRFFLVIAIGKTLLSAAFAEGVATASFAKDVAPLLATEPALREFIATLEIQDTGRCLANWDRTPDRTFPFVFPARIRGSTNEYNLVLVIDYISELTNIATKVFSSVQRLPLNDKALGAAVLPKAANSVSSQ